MTGDREGLKELFATYRRTGDRAIRDELAEAHLALATHLAKRFDRRGEPLDDLIQVASLGLVKAIERFDPGRGVEFSTFAVPTIVGELKRHFRDRTWTLRVPRRAQELHLELGAAVNVLTHELHRSPTIDEIAERMSVSTEEVLEAVEVGNAYRSDSLDAPAMRENADHPSALAARLGEEDPNLIELVDLSEITSLLDTLPERERKIIVLRFFLGLTQSEIADRIGISQMQVSRLLSRTLEQLRALGPTLTETAAE